MSKSEPKRQVSTVVSIDSRRPQQSTGLLNIEPQCCRPWDYHNRDQAWLNARCCSDLIHSIRSNGQIEPVILRALPQGSDKEFEIIAGVRRWFACSQIPNQKLLARVIEGDNRSCMILMHADNAHTQDITDFERAYSFAQHMKSGVFKNQSDLANAMELSQSTVSKMITAAEILETPWLAELFDNKREIPLRQSYHLATFLKKPALYMKLETEVKNILEENKKARLKLSALMLLQRLIDCVEPGSGGAKAEAQVLLKKDDKAMVVAKKNQAGNLALNINSGVRGFDRDQITALCVQAIHEYFIEEKQGVM